MKIVGIVIDNYKLDKYKEEFIKNEFTNFDIYSFIENTSTIKVSVPDNQVRELRKLCTRLEYHFNNSN